MNILDNAEQVMPNGGTLTITTRGSDSWVTVSIRDDSPGIPTDIQSRIFDPFLTPKECGLGSGSGAVHHLLESSGTLEEASNATASPV